VEQNAMIFRCNLEAQYRKYETEIDAAIRNVLRSGIYTLGEEVAAFESEFADYLGCDYAVGVANATDGLILAMKAYNIGKGDEVITTPFTAIPTVSAIIETGASPVFVDIDEGTFLMDVNQVPGVITPKTKAIIPVHIFGNVTDIERLRSLVPSHIPIIEDAAQAHGSRINGKHSGSLGDMAVFSFYPTKNLGGYGDGGAIVTNDTALAKKIKLLRMYGMVDKDHIVFNGVNSRLDEIQAAVLRVKLQHLNEMNDRRNEIANEYIIKLKDHPIGFQEIGDGVYSNFHVFAGTVGDKRGSLIAYLDRHQIQSNIYYPIPLHLQEANRYLGYKSGDFPKAEAVCNKIMAFPMYPELAAESLNRIISTIKKFYRNV
jgi:dTDP-4-amino-4,6-dideoxygalactose transaminase